MTITIRAGRPEDRGAVGAMLGEFMDYLHALAPETEPAADPAVIDSLLDQAFGPQPVCTTLLAERDGAAIGYVGFHPGVWEIYRTIYVVSLYVRSAARGSGAGRALMEAVRERAAQDGAARLTWEVWVKNPEAIAFYRRLGGELHEENLRMSLAVDDD